MPQNNDRKYKIRCEEAKLSDDTDRINEYGSRQLFYVAIFFLVLCVLSFSFVNMFFGFVFVGVSIVALMIRAQIEHNLYADALRNFRSMRSLFTELERKHKKIDQELSNVYESLRLALRRATVLRERLELAGISVQEEALGTDEITTKPIDVETPARNIADQEESEMVPL
jgi:hypothetical protein